MCDEWVSFDTMVAQSVTMMVTSDRQITDSEVDLAGGVGEVAARGGADGG